MKPTSIEVKCECKIPFHTELVAYLDTLSQSTIADDRLPKDIPHREAIRKALERKMLFIKIHFARPNRRWRPRLLKSVKMLLNKDLIGTIRVGRDEITLILL